MDELKAKVLAEIENYENLNGKMKYDIRSKLVDPISENYNADDGSVLELITVFRECVEGYTIAYDPEDREYCLGYMKVGKSLSYFGHYGSFMDTFLGM